MQESIVEPRLVKVNRVTPTMRSVHSPMIALSTIFCFLVPGALCLPALSFASSRLGLISVPRGVPDALRADSPLWRMR